MTTNGKTTALTSQSALRMIVGRLRPDVPNPFYGTIHITVEAGNVRLIRTEETVKTEEEAIRALGQ